MYPPLARPSLTCATHPFRPSQLSKRFSIYPDQLYSFAEHDISYGEPDIQQQQRKENTSIARKTPRRVHEPIFLAITFRLICILCIISIPFAMLYACYLLMNLPWSLPTGLAFIANYSSAVYVTRPDNLDLIKLFDTPDSSLAKCAAGA